MDPWDWHTLQGTNISPQNGILKMIFLFPWWDMLIPWRVYLPTTVNFFHQNQWNPWIGCEAPSSELEDHRFCTDCWEERVEPPGFHDNEFYELMIPNDFCLDQILRKRCDEMSMKSWSGEYFFLLLVEWNFECFWCLFVPANDVPMVHHLPFRVHDSP